MDFLTAMILEKTGRGRGMDLRLLVFHITVLLTLAALAVCIALRDRVGMAVMGGLFVYLAWVGKGLFMSH